MWMSWGKKMTIKGGLAGYGEGGEKKEGISNMMKVRQES
jgi:hypothetical protein